MSLETAEEAFAAGNSFFVDEKYEAALRKYTDAIELDDKNAGFYVARAACHLHLKNEMDALDDSTKAIELDPQNEKGYLRKGMALFALGEYEMAKSVFLKGQNVNKTSTLFVNWLNKCDVELKAEMEDDEQSGEKEADPIPIISPVQVSSPQPTYVPEETKKKAEEAKALGNTAFGKKNFKQAVQHYTTAIELDSSNHLYFSNRAMAYMRLAENQKALEDAERVISLNPSWAKGYFRKGSALLALKKYSEAEEVFRKGLETAEETDRADLESSLHIAQGLSRFQSYDSFKRLQGKAGLSDKEIADIVNHNIQKLQGQEFAGAVTSITVTVGEFWRCMKLIIIDDDGKIVRLSPPNALVGSDASIFKQLQEGDLTLAYAFVHVGKEGTEREKEQEYAFQEWVPRPEKTSSLTGGSPATTLTSQPWTNTQKEILDITIKEANRNKCLNKTVTAKLFK